MRTPPPRRRSRWVLALSIASVAAAVCAVAVVAAGSAGHGDQKTPDPRGLTTRARFFLVPVGRSHAEVQDLLGHPLTVHATVDAEAGTDCWLYGSQSGRPVRYELCFRGGLLRTKSIIPAPAGTEADR